VCASFRYDDDSEAGQRRRVRESVGEALASCGAACAFGSPSSDGGGAALAAALAFVVGFGLGDPDGGVRQAMLNAGSGIVDGWESELRLG